MKLVAIDPGTKKVGLASFHDKTLYYLRTATSKNSDRLQRCLDILWFLEEEIKTADMVVIEEPKMMGKYQFMMDRFIGMIEYLCVEDNIPIYYIHPMTVKSYMKVKKMGDKKELAKKAIKKLKKPRERSLMRRHTAAEDWDATDAVAVGLTWLKL